MKKRLSIAFLLCFFSEPVLAVVNDGGSSQYARVFLKTIAYVLIFIFVIFVALYGTKFLAKRSKTFFKSKYIEIIDSINLGSNGRIIIVKVNNYIYILSISNNDTNVIDKFEVESFYSSYRDTREFDDYLNEHLNSHIKTNINIDRFESKIKKVFNKFKSINIKTDKDEEKNEED